jgi:hypothetical protein
MAAHLTPRRSSETTEVWVMNCDHCANYALRYWTSLVVRSLTAVYVTLLLTIFNRVVVFRYCMEFHVWNRTFSCHKHLRIQLSPQNKHSHHYVRNTNKIPNFISNLFHLIYPRHVSNNNYSLSLGGLLYKHFTVFHHASLRSLVSDTIHDQYHSDSVSD